MDKKLLLEIKNLVSFLASGNYHEIVMRGYAGRLTESEISSAISTYGRQLVELPDEALRFIDIYELKDQVDAWAIDVPLWTHEEGRSDLTLSLSVKNTFGQFKIEIDDLHVL